MLADLLESRGMSQAELSRRSGMAESAISFVMSGKRKLTRRQIAKICAAFNVSPAVFEFRA
jgi:transcriptional regulator with XRE-family HTH domain